MQYEGIELENRYRLDRIVDAGNFGAVYDAVDTKFNSRVAVKILFSNESLSEQEFRSEALLARQFRHPNVVEVYEFGVDDEHNVSYIVMEFLSGLRGDVLMAEPDFDARLFCRFVDQIGSALDTAHSRQLVHRDLKPQNFMLLDRGQSTERFVLLDLGVASKTDSITTLRNKGLDGAMSPQYASPEQVRGDNEVDFRSDIYSFGTILFEWLAGQPPFRSEQLLGLVHAICEKEPPYPREVTNRELNREVEDVIIECLEKNPERRPKSIDDIRQRVLAALGSQPSSDLVFRPTGPSTPVPTELPNALLTDRKLKAAPVSAQTLIPPNEQTIEIPRSREPPTWQSSRPQAVQARPAPWPIIGLLAACVLVAGLWMSGVFSGNGDDPPTMALGLPGRVDVPAGEELQTTVVVTRAGGADAKPECEFVDVPEWLGVKVAGTYPGSIVLKLRGELIAQEQTGEFRIIVRDGSESAEATFKAHLVPPKVWVPDGFAPASKSLRKSNTHEVALHTVIEKQVADQAVRFVLIEGSVEVAPFYIMENKVWNGLLAEFDRNFPDERRVVAERDGDKELFPPVDDREGWKQGAMANAERLGIDNYPRLPVMNVNAFEAHEIALWLGGPTAHLPTARQWDTAAGYDLWKSGELKNTPWSDGPYRNDFKTPKPRIAVDQRKFGPTNVGESIDDIGPNGCRDMAGNGREFTSSVGVATARLPHCSLHALVQRRGRSYQSSAQSGPAHLTWTALDAASGQSRPDSQDANARNPATGFRVVVEIGE